MPKRIVPSREYLESLKALEKPPQMESPAGRRFYPDDSTRPNAARRGYSYRWQQYVARFLGKVNGRRRPCIACVGTVGDSWCVDHIIPVNQYEDNGLPTAEADPVFWAPWNHQPLCREHHTEKTLVHDAELRQCRGRLLRQVELLTAAGANHNDLRNFVLRDQGMWPDGWFDLSEDPVQSMQILML